MTQETIFANARLILRDRVETGTLRIADGVITDIDFGTAVPKGAQDMQGDYIAPGLVELHTDNLERHMSPRPPRSTGRTARPSSPMTVNWRAPASPPCSMRSASGR